MSKLLLTFYGDDFTGSTDALEQLTLAGIRTALFIEPPTARQLARFKGLQAVGVAGMTRSLNPAAMERELRPALKKLKSLGARHVHYKVCSTFDSSPQVGSIGRAIDVGAEVFRARFVPVLAAAPALGRYTVFGTHFARYGIGSTGAIHRLDRHPSISKHPITPMLEADLRLHLAKQTGKRIALFDVLKVALPLKEARSALKQMLAQPTSQNTQEGQFPSREGSGVGCPEVVLFDALNSKHLRTVGALLESHARRQRPLFSVGSSGIETALATQFKISGSRRGSAHSDLSGSWSGLTSAATKILVGSGSCSPVTSGQIAWALKHGFAEVPLNALALASAKTAPRTIQSAADAAAKLLQTGCSVIVHSTRTGSDRRVASRLKGDTSKILGTALGEVLRRAVAQSGVRRVCIAGGDTSSYAARALGIEALEMVALLTPGAPLCRATAPRSPADRLEVVFKGGQVGAENYFGIVENGRT